MTDAPRVPGPDSSTASKSRGDDPSRARRRLLLAAGAALPSICTLSSGAQAAATSSTACLAHQGPPPVRFTQNDDYARIPDGWLRAPVNFGQYDGTQANCVTTPQSSCVAFAPGDPRGPSALPVPSGGGPVANAENGSAWIVQGNRMVSSVHTPITQVSLSHKHYGLVYVDQSGTIATLDPNGSPNLSAVTTSCWTSMMGGRISKLG